MSGIVIDSCDDRPYGPGQTDYEYDKWRNEMDEKMTDAEQRCGAHAAFRYTWPGRDEAHICIDCTSRLQQVASALGLYVQLIPLSVKVGDPIITDWPTCDQHITKERR